MFPLQKNNLLLPPTRSSHISKKSIWHLNNTHFKPAYYTSLKNDNASEYIYIILLTFFPKYFLLSAANPRTVIRQEPILERYSTLSATTKPTVKKIFDAGRNGTARIASPMVRILKKRRLSLLSNTTCNELQLQCSRCTCVIKHRKLMLAWLCLSKVGMIMFVEFRPIYFSISPTQTFLGLHHTLTVLPHNCWGGLHYEPKEHLLGRPINNYSNT